MLVSRDRGWILPSFTSPFSHSSLLPSPRMELVPAFGFNLVATHGTPLDLLADSQCNFPSRVPQDCNQLRESSQPSTTPRVQ